MEFSNININKEKVLSFESKCSFKIKGILLRYMVDLQIMEEALCHIEISEDDNEIVGKVQSELGGLREFRATTLEDLLRMIAIELQDEIGASLTN